MKKMSSLEIREQFLKYFEENDHLKISASSVVPQNDPTLLFINSGMAPLKNYFLGRETPPSPRLANFQPCIRTKDIDDVGDRHHLTIFEMMGSWSIGDYYKEEACSLAYNLLVEGFGFDPERLYFTVYGGNEALGIAPDTESIEAWKKCGVPEDHIVVLGDDNFWGPAGEHGPCGPCTEVFFDTGDQYGPKYAPGGHFDDVSRYIEIWNAGVFMELNKLKDGTFESLPLKSVDTGSGLERLAMVMNGCDSVYETDLLKPLVDLSAELINSTDVQTTRMLSDHMRAAVVILGEGVMPGNEGQGYIPRRLIRKCVAACIARGVEKPDFTKHINKTIELLGDHYPQLRSAKDAITYNIEMEVKDFSATVKAALGYMESRLDQIISNNIFSGKEAFELVTTHGLPKDVLDMFAKQRGWTIDEDGYEKCYEDHRKASRVISRKGALDADQEKVEEAFMSDTDTIFTGYEKAIETSRVVKIYGTEGVTDKAVTGESIYFTTESTPFYGESGGQAGDVGSATSGNAELKIIDTMKIKDKHVHVAELTAGELSVNSEITLTVDEEVRNACMRNHSATHLLHSALHQVVGKHAVQKGSMVSSERLRFDFQNPGAVSKEDLDKVEALVNTWVMNNNGRETQLCGYEEALEAGAMALFGEKYDSKVRVVAFGKESVELCGGTHVSKTGDIGLFLITSETSVAKGVRRIEAVTGNAAIKAMQERNIYLRKASEELNVKPAEIAPKIKDLKKEMKQKIKEAQANAQKSTSFLTEVKMDVNGTSFFAGVMEADAKSIKAIGDDLLNKGDAKLICLVGKEDKSLKTFVWSHEDVNKKIKAGDLLKKILEPVSGRGGGKPHFAQGGSPEVNNLDKLTAGLEGEVKDWLSSNL